MLAALAVLAASGAAMAQSSVTIYGTLDVSAGKLKGGEFGLNNGINYVVPASQATTALTNAVGKSFLSTSVLGFRGVEDLGGGMKATFNLQTGGLDMSNGNPALAFSREANLGLETGAGNFKFGRALSTATAVMGRFDLNGISGASPTGILGVNVVNWYASSRRSDQIEYTSPAFNGVTARVSYIAKGDANADHTFGTTAGFTSTSTAGGTGTTIANFKDRITVGLNYDQGPLSLGFVYETKNSDLPVTRDAYAVGASYDLGVAKLAASINQNATKGGNTGATGSNLLGGANHIGATTLHSSVGAVAGKGWGIGISAPIGALTVGAQYGANTENKTKATELFANYALSKRTTVYANYGMVKDSVVRAADAAPANNVLAGTVSAPALGTIATNALRLGAIPVNPTLFNVGIRHTF
jgi:predicted porin